MTSLLLVVFCFTGLPEIQAQTHEIPYKQLKLNDLDAFDSPPSNWVIAGDVFMDLNNPLHVDSRKGEGVLVNTNEGDREDLYTTTWEHGDIDLELDFMMAKESNAGIYLQGRYEIQLLDSWGVENPKFSDLGGIYQWSENGRGTGGIPPQVNAARAPGLWQHMEIKFRAPRFDEDGNKISNARLVEVVLNGEVIHQNVKLIHPTGGAISNEEAEQGPLRFQGDHGPVAFKNIRYKRYDNEPIQLNSLTYRYFEGTFEEVSDINQSTLVGTGKAETIDLEPLKSDDTFAIAYEGTFDVEDAGPFFFELQSEGGARLSVDGKTVIENDVNTNWWESESKVTELSSGSHKVQLIYYRNEDRGGPRLALTTEGPGIERHALHAATAFPPGTPNAPLTVEPEDDPIVLRGFIQMEDRVHPHSAALGFTDGVNAGYDLKSGALMKLWKGTLVNANTIWQNRGGGNLNINEASAITVSGAPSLAYLKRKKTAWPDSLQEGVDFLYKSYRFEDDGALMVTYEWDEVTVKDRFASKDNGRVLSRSMNFDTNKRTKELFVRLAVGESISELPNGLYQADGKTYYIELDKDLAGEARIRDTKKGQELILPVSERDGSISYSYIW